MSAAKKPAAKPVATLKIGHTLLLLPADSAMKVMSLLTGAVECLEDYDRSTYKRFVVVEGEQLHCAVEMIDPKHIRMPPAQEPDPARPLRLGRS
jgi:hypothetical protein